MSYSCTDFTDDIIGTLRVEVPEELYDNPEAQVELCIERILLMERLIAKLLPVAEEYTNLRGLNAAPINQAHKLLKQLGHEK